MAQEENNNNKGNEPPKGYLIMIIVAVIVAFLFFKFVIPAMEKGEKPPSSILTGEVYESDEERNCYYSSM